MMNLRLQSDLNPFQQIGASWFFMRTYLLSIQIISFWQELHLSLKLSIAWVLWALFIIITVIKK